MKRTLPYNTIERLCRLYSLSAKLLEEGKDRISSSGIEKITGIPSHTIRKDLSMAGTAGSTRGGYEIQKLKTLIGSLFDFNVPKKACIVGLEMPGLAMLDNPEAEKSGFKIIAGFDSNINRMEMIKTGIPLFPSYEITEKVRHLSIELAILAVAPENAENTALKLAAGGIRGIINFSPVILSFENPGIIVRNIYLPEELRLLTAMIAAENIKSKGDLR